MRTAAFIFFIFFMLSGCGWNEDLFTIFNGQNLAQSGQFMDAIVEWEKVENKTAILRHNLGLLYYDLDNYNMAEQYWKTLISEDDRDIQFYALFNLGCLSYETEAFRQALNYFRECLILKPGNRQASVNFELALEAFKKMENEAVSINPPDDESSSRLDSLAAYLLQLDLVGYTERNEGVVISEEQIFQKDW